MHECATTTTGASNGSAPWLYPFRWMMSGRRWRSNSSSHSPAASTSRHGSSIHSCFPAQHSRLTLFSSAAARRCSSVGAGPRHTSVYRTPSPAVAAATSSPSVHTPPTLSIVISTCIVGAEFIADHRSHRSAVSSQKSEVSGQWSVVSDNLNISAYPAPPESGSGRRLEAEGAPACGRFPPRSYREPLRGKLVGGTVNALQLPLLLQPAGQFPEALVQRHPRLVPQHIPRKRDVREAMPDVTRPVPLRDGRR